VKRPVTILGAGLSGALMAIYLARQGLNRALLDHAQRHYGIDPRFQAARALGIQPLAATGR
jgi:2-polyprenyl-6-methoxyphenol hydroxylase-like FAD-dependent oxidoreductase